MPLHPPVPILRVFDEAMALAFYVDYLGFHLDWRHVFEENLPVYLQVSRDGCVLHLTEHFGDATPGARLRVRVDDLAGLHAEVTARAYRYLRPGIENTPWGDLEMTLTDPFGNRITLFEPPQP